VVAPPTSVLLSVVATVSPLPQRLDGRGRDAVKWCGGERLGCKFSGVGKKVGVVGKVYFIGVRIGADTRKVLAVFHCTRNQWNQQFPK
jgi:hypothetical protein